MSALLSHRSFVGAAILALFSLAGPCPAAAEGTQVYVIPIHGDIEASTAVFVRRNAEAALKAGAAFLVFDIDTFGGRVDSALRISSYIGSIRKARTIAYVRSGPDSMGVSWSAGALIAFSCSAVYMAPGTSMGAAAPVIMSPEGKTEGAGEKSVSAVRSQMAALAEKNGYPPALALAMVDADVELYEMEVDGKRRIATAEEAASLEKENPGKTTRVRTISAKGKLLSVTAGEAERYGLSSGTVFDLETLVGVLGSKEPARVLEPSAADRAVVFLTSGAVQSLLILLGLVAIFLEINSPGFGIPGTVAIIAFFTLFGANALMGTVGSLEIILFILGIALLAVEIFILPGFGVMGISGIVLIGAALVFSMQDFGLPTVSWEWDLMGRNALTVFVGILAAIAGIGVLALAGPRLKLFDRLTLKTTIEGTAAGPLAPGKTGQDAAAPPPSPLAGKRGVARTTLRPSGRAEIEGTTYSVETEGLFVEEGSPIKVLYVQGSRVVVGPDAPGSDSKGPRA